MLLRVLIAAEAWEEDILDELAVVVSWSGARDEGQLGVCGPVEFHKPLQELSEAQELDSRGKDSFGVDGRHSSQGMQGINFTYAGCLI